MTNLGVLVSGNGSNLQAILDATQSGILQGMARVALVISNRPGILALERAQKAGVKSEVVLDGENTDDFLIARLKASGVELVCLAGYMRLLGPAFLAAFPEHVLNMHPALLPAFPGLHAQRRAWEYGVKFSGATVHFVDIGVDTGPIILQAVVPVQDRDTAETLQNRILEQEHRIYPEAIRLVCQGRLVVSGRQVSVRAD